MRIPFLWIFLFLLLGESLAQKDSSMKFDLGISKGQNIHLWPIIRRIKAPKYKNTEILFSIFQKKKDRNKFVNHAHLFPIFYYDSTRKYKQIKIASLYYPSLFTYTHKFKDSTKSYKVGEIAPGLSLFEATKSGNGLFVKNNALFFLWLKKDIKNDKAYAVVFPLYWYFQNGPEKISTLFPISWSYKNKDIYNNVSFPLVWNLNNDRYKSFTFIPLFSFGKSPSGHKTHLVITPLFFQFKDTNSLSRLVFPVYWHYKIAETRHFNSLGKTIYYRYQKENTHLFPFYFSNYQSSYWDTSFSKVLFPFYWQIESGKRKKNVFFPVYWHYRDVDIENKVLFPIVWNFKNKYYKSFTFFPLFSSGISPYKSRSHLMITPFYWQNKNGNTTTQLLLPFYWHKKLTELRYLNSTNSSSYTHNHEVTCILPLYICIRTNYLDSSLRRIIFPFYWKLERNKIDSSFHFFARYLQKTTLFPIYYNRVGPRKKAFAVFPFYYFSYHKYDSTKTFGITPLFWYSKNKERKYVIVFPIYWYKQIKYSNSKEVKHTLFPIWFSRIEMGSDTQKLKLLFPLYMRQKNWNGHNSLTIMPFYSKGSSKDGKNTHFAITPFYWQVNSSNYKRYVFFPIYWRTVYKHSSNQKESYTVLFPVFYRGIREGKKYTVVFPLVWYINKYWKRAFVVFPFYFDKKIIGSHRITIFPIVWYHYDKGVNLTFNFKKFTIFPLYWSNINLTKSQYLFFPFYFSSKNKINGDYTVMRSPLYWEVANSNINLKMALPFYYSIKKLNRHHEVLFPLFWYKKILLSESSSQTSYTLFPIIKYKKQQDSAGKIIHSTLGIYPLYYISKSKKKTDFIRIITPLIWRIENPYLSLKMVLPVYYSIENYKAHQKILYPLYWYKKTFTENKISEISYTVFPLVWYKKNIDTLGKITNSSLGVFPLFYYSVSHNSNNHYKIITPLYWDIKKTEYSLKLAFPLYLNYRNLRSSYYSFNYIKAITPLYWQWEKENKKRTLYFPLLLKTKSTNGDLNYGVLGILYRQQKTDTRNSIQLLWPLISFTRESNSVYGHIAPFLWYKKSAKHSYFSIMPLFYISRNNETHSLNILWQLLNIKTTPKKKTVGILFHALHFEKYKNGDYANRFLYLLYADVNKKGNIEKSLFPIYYISKDTSGNKYFGTMLSFYARSSKKINQTKYFYTEERIFWIMRLRSNYKYLKAKGIVKSRKELR